MMPRPGSACLVMSQLQRRADRRRGGRPAGSLDAPSRSQIVAAVYEALAQRHPHSRRRGRRGTPAEVVLRLLVLKRIRNWSYGVLEREVRANLVYRDFTRVGGAKMPDAKTMGRWGLALGPAVIEQIYDRIVQFAQAEHVVPGRRMRVDTTVVETNIHYPTDSSLLGDGVRVLSRTMKKITKLVGTAGAKLRDRSRSVKHRLLEIGRTVRAKAMPNQAGTVAARRWPVARSQRPVVGQAKRFSCDRRRRQTLRRGRQAGDAGGSASGPRCDDPAGPDEPSTSLDLAQCAPASRSVLRARTAINAAPKVVSSPSHGSRPRINLAIGAERG
jgi:hypothetical protein